MLIPLRDINSSRTFPIFTVLIIMANVVIFIAQRTVSADMLQAIYNDFGFIPARVTGMNQAYNAGSMLHNFISLFTSMFLHAGLLHLVGNMWVLWLFGDNVEDRFGHLQFLVFYLVAGVIASLTHMFMHPASTVTTVGASGAIAGVMAAYVLLFPNAKIEVLFWFFIIFVRKFQISAWFFIGIWFLIQLYGGFGSLASGQVGGIAFWAHVGGFASGIAITTFLKIRKY